MKNFGFEEIKNNLRNFDGREKNVFGFVAEFAKKLTSSKEILEVIEILIFDQRIHSVGRDDVRIDRSQSANQLACELGEKLSQNDALKLLNLFFEKPYSFGSSLPTGYFGCNSLVSQFNTYKKCFVNVGNDGKKRIAIFLIEEAKKSRCPGEILAEYHDYAVEIGMGYNILESLLNNGGETTEAELSVIYKYKDDLRYKERIFDFLYNKIAQTTEGNISLFYPYLTLKKEKASKLALITITWFNEFIIKKGKLEEFVVLILKKLRDVSLGSGRGDEGVNNEINILIVQNLELYLRNLTHEQLEYVFNTIAEKIPKPNNYYWRNSEYVGWGLAAFKLLYLIQSKLNTTKCKIEFFKLSLNYQEIHFSYNSLPEERIILNDNKKLREEILNELANELLSGAAEEIFIFVSKKIPNYYSNDYCSALLNQVAEKYAIKLLLDKIKHGDQDYSIFADYGYERIIEILENKQMHLESMDDALLKLKNLALNLLIENINKENNVGYLSGDSKSSNLTKFIEKGWLSKDESTLKKVFDTLVNNAQRNIDALLSMQMKKLLSLEQTETLVDIIVDKLEKKKSIEILVKILKDMPESKVEKALTLLIEGKDLTATLGKGYKTYDPGIINAIENLSDRVLCYSVKKIEAKQEGLKDQIISSFAILSKSSYEIKKIEDKLDELLSDYQNKDFVVDVLRGGFENHVDKRVFFKILDSKIALIESKRALSKLQNELKCKEKELESQKEEELKKQAELEEKDKYLEALNQKIKSTVSESEAKELNKTIQTLTKEKEQLSETLVTISKSNINLSEEIKEKNNLISNRLNTILELTQRIDYNVADIRNKLEKINVYALENIIKKEKLELNAQEELKEMIESNEYRLAFYKAVQWQLNSLYLALISIDSGIVPKQLPSGITGKVGNLLEGVSGHIPIFGIGFNVLGQILNGIDKSDRDAKLKNMIDGCKSLASDAVTMTKIAEGIARKLAISDIKNLHQQTDLDKYKIIIDKASTIVTNALDNGISGIVASMCDHFKEKINEPAELMGYAQRFMIRPQSKHIKYNNDALDTKTLAENNAQKLTKYIIEHLYEIYEEIDVAQDSKKIEIIVSFVFKEYHDSAEDNLVTAQDDFMASNQNLITDMDSMSIETVSSTTISTSVTHVYMQSGTTETKVPHVATESSSSSKKNSCIISFLKDISYDNELLNNNELLTKVCKIGGIHAVNILTELAQNKDITKQILLTIDEFGVEKALEIFFSNESRACEAEFISETLQANSAESVNHFKPAFGSELSEFDIQPDDNDLIEFGPTDNASSGRQVITVYQHRAEGWWAANTDGSNNFEAVTMMRYLWWEMQGTADVRITQGQTSNVNERQFNDDVLTSSSIPIVVSEDTDHGSLWVAFAGIVATGLSFGL